MKVGVHIVFSARGKPREIGLGGTELTPTNRFCPSEHFIFVTFFQNGNLVVFECKRSIDVDLLSAEYIAADDAKILGVSTDEILEGAHFYTGKGVDIARIHGGRTTDGHFSHQVQLAFIEEFSNCSQHHRRDGPNYVSFADRTEMVNLYTYISGRMFSFKIEFLYIFQFLKRGFTALAIGNDNAFVRQFCQCVNTGLDVFDFIFAGKINIGSQRCGREC